MAIYRHLFKRLIDLALSIIGLVILFPFIVIIALMIIFINKSNPFFIQTRPGFKAQPFLLIKFRTMRDIDELQNEGLHDRVRITKLGQFLRNFSFDEIPQLWNVVKGEMSLIGPRPLLTSYLPLYDENQKRRHDVKPGITGWAQVNGRNVISWEDKFEYDVWYVDNLSFILDVKILYLTILKVFNKEGVNQDSNVISEEFKGEL